MFNCLTCLSLVWQRGVGVGGREDKEAGFKKETGQQAQRDPGGLSIDK